MMNQHIAATLDLCVHDADEIGAFYARIFRRCEFEPIGHEPSLSLKASGHRIGPLSLVVTSSPSGIRFLPAAPADYFVIKSTVGREEVFGTRQYQMDERMAVILEARQIKQLVLHAGATDTSLMVRRDALTQHLAAMLDAPVHKPLEFHPTFDPRSHAGALLLALTAMLHQGLGGEAPLRAAPIATGNIIQAISDLLLESMEHNFSAALQRPTGSASPRQIKRAIDFMQNNLGRPISLVDIAEAAQVSTRALQAAFREFKSATPMAYLRTLRLEAAHRDLSGAAMEVNVADVARRWGFTHLGRFAAEYHSAFGIYPSQQMRLANDQRRAS